MNKVVINDFAPLADKNAHVDLSSSPCQNEVNLLDDDNRELINYASFSWNGIDLLDPDLILAENNDNIGYISEEISDNTAVFPQEIKLSIGMRGGLYSAPGITFHFWQHYCTEVEVKWYRYSELISTKTFYPDSLEFYGDNKVEDFNRVIFYFKKTQTPHQFVKLAGIDLGKIREITDIISNIEIFTEISPDCSDVPGSTCDFIAGVTDFKPQDMQELYVYGGKEQKLFGKYIIDRAPSVGKNKYSFECSDEIMKTDKPTYPQKEQSTYKISELNADIKEYSNVDIKCEEYNDVEVVGFVEKNKSVRLTAAMISFALGCFLTGFNSKSLRMIKPKNRRDKIISASQILGKAEYSTKSPYTEIVINQYTNEFGDPTDSCKKTFENKRATDAANPLIYDKYSLTSDINEMLNRVVETGFRRNEITARIIYKDEALGDICKIETPYDGIKTGLITSMNISLGHRITATINMIERDFSSEGGED